MKPTSIGPVVGVVFITLTVLACSIFGGTTTPSTQQPPQPNSQPNPQSTIPPAATQPAASKYFQEDFNGTLDNWTQYVVNGSKVPKGGNPELVKSSFGTMTVGIKDGFLVFDLESAGQWIYEIYNAQQYDDVRLDVSAENRGNNDNNISLICRYTPNQGWYEFNVANNGLYDIYYASVQQTDGAVIYSKIADGGYNKIKQGKQTNQIGISCKGHTLTLVINNYQVKQIDDNDYVLTSGEVGVSTSSFTDPPAIVGYDWVKISQP